MVPPDDNLISQLNDQLLQSAGPEPQKEETSEPKRNSKDDIINKLVKVAEENHITVEHSNTRLRRMTKSQLNKLLAETIEKGVQNQMAEQVGVQRGASERVIALGALRMVHNLAANAAEKGLNSLLPKYGYEVEGFATSLEEPPVKEAVDACLEEIARESDILSYIESPYARLSLAWGGAMMASLKRQRKYNRYKVNSNASHMEPRSSGPKNPVQPSSSRRTPDGKEQRGVRFADAHAVPV